MTVLILNRENNIQFDRQVWRLISMLIYKAPVFSYLRMCLEKHFVDFNNSQAKGRVMAACLCLDKVFKGDWLGQMEICWRMGLGNVRFPQQLPEVDFYGSGYGCDSRVRRFVFKWILHVRGRFFQ